MVDLPSQGLARLKSQFGQAYCTTVPLSQRAHIAFGKTFIDGLEHWHGRALPRWRVGTLLRLRVGQCRAEACVLNASYGGIAENQEETDAHPKAEGRPGMTAYP
jgi:hypothetical protein